MGPDDAQEAGYEYAPLTLEEPGTIRVLTILPRSKDDADNTSPIRCIISHRQIGLSHLAQGIPAEALVGRHPTVNFHTQVKNRPTEKLVTPHALGLVRYIICYMTFPEAVTENGA